MIINNNNKIGINIKSNSSVFLCSSLSALHCISLFNKKQNVNFGVKQIFRKLSTNDRPENDNGIGFDTYGRPNSTHSITETCSPFFDDGGKKLVAFINSLNSVMKLSTNSTHIRTTACSVIWYFILFHILVDTAVLTAFSGFNGGLTAPVPLMFVLLTFCRSTQTGAGKVAPGWFGKVVSGYQYSVETFRSYCETFLDIIVVPAFKATIFNSLVHSKRINNPMFKLGSNNLKVNKFIYIDELDNAFLLLFWAQFDLFNFKFDSNDFMNNVNQFFLVFNSSFYYGRLPLVSNRFFDNLSTKLYIHNFRSSSDGIYWCDYRVPGAFASESVISGVILFLNFYSPKFYACSGPNNINKSLFNNGDIGPSSTVFDFETVTYTIILNTLFDSKYEPSSFGSSSSMTGDGLSNNGNTLGSSDMEDTSPRTGARRFSGKATANDKPVVLGVGKPFNSERLVENFIQRVSMKRPLSMTAYATYYFDGVRTVVDLPHPTR